MFPLVIIVLIALISLTYTPGTPLTGQVVVNQPGEITVNGTTSDIKVPGAGTKHFDLNLDPIQGVLIILAAAIIIGTASGIHILGSGLGDLGQKLLYNSLIYFGLWGIFSILGFNLLNQMDYGFGFLIWIVLTICYVIGFTRTTEGSASD
jgi:hypothetical protein